MQLKLIAQLRHPDGRLDLTVLAEREMDDECKCKRGRVRWLTEMVHGNRIEVGDGKVITLLVESENKLPVRAGA